MEAAIQADNLGSKAEFFDPAETREWARRCYRMNVQKRTEISLLATTETTWPPIALTKHHFAVNPDGQ